MVFLSSDSHDHAVSPVIAIILMLAITVILAALVATITLGMTTNIHKTKTVTGIVSQAEANHIVVTYVGGQDQKVVTGVRWDIIESTGATHSTLMGLTSPHAPTPLLVGREYSFTGNFQGKDHIIATAFFTDGTQQVILENFI